MKYIPPPAAIFLFVVGSIACSGNKSANSGVVGTSDSSVDDSTYTGDNSLSYTINGRHIGIKDYMHDGDGKNWLGLFLGKVKSHPETGMVEIDITNELSKEVFKFSVLNSGTTQVNHYRPTLATFSDKKTNIAEYMSPKYVNYYGDAVTVTVADFNQSHVSGTFSGKFLSGDDKPVPLEITDGRFDLRFTKN